MVRRLVIICVALCLSCSHSGVKKENTAEDLYHRADKELEGRRLLWLIPVKDYQAAIEGFKKVIDLYPYSPWAVKAELRIADATLQKGEYLEAVNLYKEFQKKHPTNEDIPYVIYQIGASYLSYQDSLSLVGGIPYDRDLVAVENALVEFGYLSESYPSSPYSEKAREKAAVCRDLIAKHDIYVGDFYYSRQEYQAALPRYRKAEDEDPGSPLAEKALYYLARCYARLGETDRARETLGRLIQSFPNGAYASDAKGKLAAHSMHGEEK